MMSSFLKSNNWWGAPKKLSEQQQDRKVSWLELFYDLVYVIAIAKITTHFYEHVDVTGFLNYLFFFSIIFWSWLNGSLYHDIHESEGLRTKLMTLWQILIVAGLVITIDSKPEDILFNVTIALLVMQLFITYLWWSIRFYDPSHKRLNLPYTFLYLSASLLLFISLGLSPFYARILLISALILNVLPPFVSSKVHKKKPVHFSLSSTMSERLGLFAIILFGEVISSIVNGIGQFHQFSFEIWLNFGLSVIIVFSLWWLFFTLISDRICKPGIVKSSIFELLYLPTLIALGLLSMSFKGIFKHHHLIGFNFLSLKEILGYSISLFLLGICFLSFLLEFSEQSEPLKKKVQLTLSFTSIFLILITLINTQVGLSIYLVIIFVVLVITIILLNLLWFAHHSKNDQIPHSPKENL